MIDISEILRNTNCKDDSINLYSPLLGNVNFSCFDEFGYIKVYSPEIKKYFTFDKYGRYLVIDSNQGSTAAVVSKECMLFPIGVKWEEFSKISDNFNRLIGGLL